MMTVEECNEKVRNGWIRTWMMFEVLAVNESTTKSSIEKLLNNLEKDPRAKMYKKSFGELKTVDKPLPNIELGYSITCEVELVTQKLENLVQIVMEYGPSAIELLEPKKIGVDVGEAQSILNSISQMLHEFAAAGAGGILLLKANR